MTDRPVHDVEHLQKLVRHLLLVVAGPVAQHDDGIGQHQFFSAGQKFGLIDLLDLGRRRQIAKLGPVAADNVGRLGTRGNEVAIERGQVLEIEHAAERGLADAEVDQGVVGFALCGLDAPDGARGIVIFIERIEITRDERDTHSHRWREAHVHAQPMQVGPAGGELDAMAPDQAVNLELERASRTGLSLVAGKAAACDVNRSQRQSALALAANDRPDKIAPFADFDIKVAKREATAPLHRAVEQFLPERQNVGTDPL